MSNQNPDFILAVVVEANTNPLADDADAEGVYLIRVNDDIDPGLRANAAKDAVACSIAITDPGSLDIRVIEPSTGNELAEGDADTHTPPAFRRLSTRPSLRHPLNRPPSVRLMIANGGAQMRSELLINGLRPALQLPVAHLVRIAAGKRLDLNPPSLRLSDQSLQFLQMPRVLDCQRLTLLPTELHQPHNPEHAGKPTLGDQHCRLFGRNEH